MCYNRGMLSVEVDGVYVAAHELKGPLALVRQLALGLNAENVERQGGKIVKVSERAMRQVNDLVKVARLEDGLFEMEPVAVRAVCDEVTAELKDLFQAEKLNLSVRYQNKSRLAVANKELLSSVVYNFLLNALHFAEENSVTTLTVKERQGRLRIDVRDFGPALPTAVWREMQNGFIERPVEIAMRPGSSGLGLYIASRFSKYMHGQVGAVRHRDGASFYVELPVSEQVSIFEFLERAA